MLPVEVLKGLSVPLGLSQTAPLSLPNSLVESKALLSPKIHTAYSLSPRDALNLK